MKYALLVVEYPADDTPSGQTAPGNFLRGVLQKLGTTPKALALNAFCWLCPLEHGLYELCILSDEARSRGCTTRTLFFDQEPPFVVSSPSPS